MKLLTKYGDKNIEFEVQYRNRKTLAIQMEPLDKIVALSPIGLSEELIKEKVKSKGRWIIKKLIEFKEIGYEPFKREFVDGETFMYLGRNYSLEVTKDDTIKRPKVYQLDGKFHIETPSKDQNVMRKAMIKW